MKILFIMNESTMHERLGLMYLSSSLKAKNHEVKLVLVSKIGMKGLFDLMRAYSPRVVGYSAMTGEHVKLSEINKALKKEFKFLSIFGGPHPTFFQEFIQEDGVDGICLGEGDLSFVEFCNRVENNGNYWNTPNFIVKYKGTIYRNALMPLVQDLDSLPFADRELVYEAEPELLTNGGKTFSANRGCPFMCTYCFNKRYNELYPKQVAIRNRSPENFVEEILSVKNRYPLNMVWIRDDTFTLKPYDWYVKFSKLYKEKINLPFICCVRANVVTEGTMSLLKDAGLSAVWMGIECANERIANDILKRGLSNAEIEKAAEIIKRHGIKLITQNMNGMPVTNSYAADLETLDLNIKIRPIFAWSSILYPYPNTEIAEYARKQGFMSDKESFLETNKISTIFLFPEKEKRKIENLHKLFGIIVQFPFLRRFCNFLCGLPLGRFYTALFYIWYGYSYKVRISPFRSFRKEIGRYLRLWLNFMKKS